MLGTSEKGFCIRTGCAHVKVTPLSFCAVIVFFFFIFPFAKKELESVCNCETDFALPKRLFIGKAG